MNAASIARLPLLLAACAAGVTSVACTGAGRPPGDLGGQAYYQTAFPAYDTSEMLRRAFEPVRRIQITATYETYSFASERAPTEAEVGAPDLLRSAVDTATSTQERAATAVALSWSSGSVALLTVDHVLALPDTIVRFFEEESGRAGAAAQPVRSRRVESVSIKTHQSNWVVGATLDPFEVLARDPVRDLALVGIREMFEPPVTGPLPGPSLEALAQRTSVLALPAGDSNRLSWGSFVYVLGYPRGYPMVTRGVVSPTDHPTVDSFLVDGLWNRGMSGGLILAVRADGRGLEWVGVARAAAASTEVRLVPEEGTEPRGDTREPYDGQIFLEVHRRIDYGITHSIPMYDIRRFLDEQRPALAPQGFVLPRL